MNKDDYPSVTIVLPARNEEGHIAQCLEALCEQEYPNISEILVFDGISDDRTKQIVLDFQRIHPKVKVFDNPAKYQTVALNMGIQLAQGEVVVRADAHASYDKDYVWQCVQALRSVEKAAAVVSIQRIDIEAIAGRIGKAIAIAHQSRFGIGVSRFHDPQGEEGWVRAGYLGAYWRRALLEVGGYREELVRSEDIDLYSRLYDLGYGVYLSSKPRVYYSPRRTLGGLWKQNFANGIGVIQSLFINYRALSPRHLVPFAFITAILVSAILAIFWPLAKIALLSLLVSYGLGVCLFSVVEGLKHGSAFIIMPVVFVTIHVAYGLGSLWGLGHCIFRRAARRDMNIFQ